VSWEKKGKRLLFYLETTGKKKRGKKKEWVRRSRGREEKGGRKGKTHLIDSYSTKSFALLGVTEKRETLRNLQGKRKKGEKKEGKRKRLDAS